MKPVDERPIRGTQAESRCPRCGFLLDGHSEHVDGPLDQGSPNVFRLEGEYWLIAFGEDLFRLKDSKGLRYLARLLSQPGNEVLALQLMTGQLAGTHVDHRLPAASGLRLFDPHGGDPVIDERARRAYEERLEQLKQTVEAEAAAGNHERAETAREEMEVLSHELGAAVGIGGGIRKTASPAEKARQSTTKAIRSAVARITEHSPALARHLGSTVRTGLYCIYDPDPRVPVAWRL